jgi:hypothetical protein
LQVKIPPWSCTDEQTFCQSELPVVQFVPQQPVYEPLLLFHISPHALKEFMLALIPLLFAFDLALLTLTMTMVAKIPMMAMTTKSSINVKPFVALLLRASPLFFAKNCIFFYLLFKYNL